MQNRIKMNGTEIYQPDEGLGYSFQTTYSEDSVRDQSGVGHFTPLSTVESLSYSASYISMADASRILRIVAKGETFTLHYYSPYYGVWRDDEFYVGQGQLSIGRLIENEEMLESLSFNMTGVIPI